MRFYMKQHEREYFIARIRLGVYNLKVDNQSIVIKTPTVEDEFFMNERFMEDYERCLMDGIKTEDEILDWMRDKELWTQADDDKESGLKKDIENMKKEVYNNRHRTNVREAARSVLRAGEKQLAKILDKKSKFYGNTCEGIANIGKVEEFFRRCTYKDNKILDLENIKIENLSSKYYSGLCDEKKIRKLARSEPWRSIWVLRDSGSYRLFNNLDRQLSPDQKNILIWSRMYDNVHESPDCPSDEVLEDDDMLDGWFAIQADKKRDSVMESELDSKLSNQKIANSPEVFLMADNMEDANRINNMNSNHAKMVKKQRFHQIKNQNGVDAGQFADERMDMNRKSNQQFKDKFRR